MSSINVHECTFSKFDENGDAICNEDGSVRLFTCHDDYDWSYIASLPDEWLDLVPVEHCFEDKKLEEKVIRYALVYLHANWEEADAEDLEIDELVLDGTLTRLIKQRTEK